jgi:hypothetical protein
MRQGHHLEVDEGDLVIGLGEHHVVGPGVEFMNQFRP